MHEAYRCACCGLPSPQAESSIAARHAAQAAGWVMGFMPDETQPAPACPACANRLCDAAPPTTFFETMAHSRWPELPARQSRSVATWLWHGWAVASIGPAGEVNIQRGEGLKRELAYVRPDGAFRSA